MPQKTIVITGANSGIGKAAAEGLAKQGARIVMVCRNVEKAEAARAEIVQASGNEAVEIVACDLASLASIRESAAEIQRICPRIDVLLNNAGVVINSRQKTADGFEMQFGTNHLGPFALTNLLLPTLKKSAPARIVTVSSGAHWVGRLNFDDLNKERGPYIGILHYATTKLENILFTRELARRLEGTGVTANCLHPGGVNTPIFDAQIPAYASFIRKVLRTPEDGAATSVFLATSPEVEGVSGEYFVDCKKARTSPASKNTANALRLWAVSEKLCGLA